MISGAPWSFSAAVLLIGTAIWFFVNLVDQGAFHAKDATIETLKAQIDTYKEKLNGASPEEAKAKIDDLERRLARIEPRTLSTEQRTTISKIIGAMAQGNYSLSIQTDMSCADCGQYAADFQAILVDAHWTIEMPKVLGASAASPKGIAILTPDPSNPLPEASGLIRALTAANIPFDLKADAAPPGVRRASVAALLITAKASP